MTGGPGKIQGNCFCFAFEWSVTDILYLKILSIGTASLVAISTLTVYTLKSL